MTFIVSTAARIPTQPAIQITSPTNVSLTVKLSTPSVEPLSGIASYLLQRSRDGITWQDIASVLPTGFPYLDQVGLAAGQTYFYRAYGVDNFNSYKSAPSTITSGTTTSTSAIKYNPGHWAENDFYTTTSPSTDGTFANCDRMAAANGFQGIRVQFYWSTADIGTTGFVPNPAFVTAINAIRNRLQTNYSKPYRLMLTPIVESQEGNAGLPTYIVNGISGHGSDSIGATQSAGPTGVAAALWRAPVMNNYVAMMNYFGSLWDSDPYFEAMIVMEETSIGYDTPLPSDYSGAAFLTQVESMIVNLTQWPTTIKFIPTNFGPNNTSESWISQLVAVIAATKGWGAGGGDLLTPPDETWGSLEFEAGSGSAGIDYRTKIPFFIEEAQDYYAYLKSGQSAAGDEAYCFGQLHPTHVAWIEIPKANYSGANVAATAVTMWDTSLAAGDAGNGVVASLEAVNFRVAASALTRPANC